VWGADWAAVVPPSPRDEASAKQVLPWRDRHGPQDGGLQTAVGSPVCEGVVPWLCCAAPPAARDRCQCTTDQPHPICPLVLTQAFTNTPQQIPIRDASLNVTCMRSHPAGSVVAYQRDSPSRMCDGSHDEGVRMVYRSLGCYVIWALYRSWIRLNTPLKQPYPGICIHIEATSGLVWRTVLRPHTSASSLLPSPLPTRMSLHHLKPSHPPHPVALA
jgi:hypothetical protein